MTSETIALVLGVALGLPFVLLFGFMVWRDFVSPEARARSKAYDLGVEQGLDGADWHSSPFESSRLTKAYQDGIEDARLFQRRTCERQHLKKDLAKLKK